jgi:hypothetical protein
MKPRLISQLLFVTFIPTLALADEVSCGSAQNCVDNSLSTVVQECLTANPGCTAQNTDAFAVSPGILADRAIALKNCSNKTFTKKKACNRCYQNAKAPLKHRYDTELFHGLLGKAVYLVEEERQERCATLP